jgi:sugar (pentulose or hexulose) kinase
MPLSREGREKWLAHLNNPPAAAWPAFKLVWWREHHPERWPQLAKVLMPKDYINFMLTGAMATDYSEASCYFLMDSETRAGLRKPAKRLACGSTSYRT